jgi:phage terminase small subunit
VLAHWISIARANPNDLIEGRRTCCRFCHGKSFGYQRTPAEMASAASAWEAHSEKAPDGTPLEPFDEQGGIGYDARKDPHPHCPECFGEGVVVVFVKDTRQLSAGARLLYAGVKETENGIEIEMRDQDAALLNVAKHLGMLVNKHEHSGPDGAEIPISFIRFKQHEPRADHAGAAAGN